MGCSSLLGPRTASGSRLLTYLRDYKLVVEARATLVVEPGATASGVVEKVTNEELDRLHMPD